MPRWSEPSWRPDLGALLYANKWIGPARLTQGVFLNGFAKVFGRQPRFRKNHAKGVAVTGYFDSNGNGSTLSKAVVFAPSHPGDRAIFVAGGNPHASDASSTARGLGLVFGSPAESSGGWRPESSSFPGQFTARLLRPADRFSRGSRNWQARSDGNGAIPGRTSGNGAGHGHRQQHPPTTGFADSVYSGLNAFYFVNASGARAPVRWSLTPLQQALPPSSGPNALFDALIRQLRAGPLRWRFVLTVGAASDPTHDATLPWPAGRRSVDAGVLTLDSVKTDAPGNARDINFDPLALPAGIEPSDDRC